MGTIEKLVKPVIDTGKAITSRAAASGRSLARSGAKVLVSGEKPVQIITDKALKLNKISHETVAGLVATQANALEGTLEGAATRLKTAAEASTLNELFDDQIALIPATRKRLAGDVRKAVDVLADSRHGLKAIFDETLTEFGQLTERRNETVQHAHNQVEDAVHAVA